MAVRGGGGGKILVKVAEKSNAFVLEEIYAPLASVCMRV